MGQRIAISNIAWPAEQDEAVARLMGALGIDAVELAPTRVWPKPLETPAAEIEKHRKFWAGHGIDVVALQSLLFGRPDLVIFGSAEVRAETARYLEGMLELAARLGAKPLVFGSPGNRKRGELPLAEAQAIAVDFFGALGRRAEALGVVMCVEPNPPQYQCDFVTRAAEGAALVRDAGQKGFGLHLDAAAMTLAGDDVSAAIADGAPLLRHFHFSAPQLGHVQRSAGVDYAACAGALKSAGYAGVASVEMRPQGVGARNLALVGETLGFVAGLFRD